mgnify:CR=1 FL=1
MNESSNIMIILGKHYFSSHTIINQYTQIKLKQKQKDAIFLYNSDEPIVFFEGLPGTGKTEILKTVIKINGVDKELVSKVAADIKSLKPVEPYKGKGIKERGQFILRKEGKKK